MAWRQGRPVFLDLRQIKQPITAIVSILHRVSGVLMFLALPWSIYLLDRSLTSPAGFAEVSAFFDRPLVKLVAFVLLWSLLHHAAAGVRYLLIDFDIGIEIEAARRSARAVTWSAAIAAILAGLVLL